MTKSRTGALLEHWRPPPESGEPVGCLASTFTFDPGFFEEECLARFLEVDTLADREGLAYMLERDNRLGAVYAGVLVDQRQAGVDHSLRWDVLSVRLPGGVQHAKISLIAWTEHVRILVSSANLTQQGYRTNQEVAGTFTFSPDGADRDEFSSCISFFQDLIQYVPGGYEDPSRTRALDFLGQIQKRVLSWRELKRRKTRVRRHFVFTLPETGISEGKSAGEASSASSLMSCLEICRHFGPAPAEAWVASPFFDPDDGESHDKTLRALCKGMGRGVARRLTLCVPPIGQTGTDSIRLAAPKSLYRAGKDRVDHLRVEILPVIDHDKNRRPWHAKMVWLESGEYSALMIGSSNFTQAGMGLRKNCNAEANLLYIACHEPYARGRADLAKCWPGTAPVEDPENSEWTGEQYSIEEGEPALAVPLLPAGFISARYRAGKKPKLVLVFLPGKLPPSWMILGGSKHDELIMDFQSLDGEDKETTIELDWRDNHAPGKLLVKWDDRQAFWPVNVEDQSALSMPDEIAAMSAQDLMTIIAAVDSSNAFRAWCRERGISDIDEELDCALPAELDPLRRFNLRDTFLHRMRRQARLMAAVKRNIERPVWSTKALDWRINGTLGIKRLGDRLAKEMVKTKGKDAESVLVLADFLLMLTEVNYNEAAGCLSRSEFGKAFKPFVRQTSMRINREIRNRNKRLPSEIQSFWKEVYDRCRI